jgi:hypothetical protein
MTDNDTRLADILDQLTKIAGALVTPPPPTSRAPATPEQSATIVDYLVLRQLVGRIADGTSRVLAAERRTGGVLVFEAGPPFETGTRVAVFTGRGNPAEVVTLGTVVDLRKSGGSGEQTVTLTAVADTEPIVRIEIRRPDDTTVALGPRLAAVA